MVFSNSEIISNIKKPIAIITKNEKTIGIEEMILKMEREEGKMEGEI